MTDAAFGQVATKTEEPIAGLPPYTGVSTSTVLGRIEFGLRGESVGNSEAELSKSDRDLEIAQVFTMRSGELVPWQGEFRTFYLSRFETDSDLKTNVVATGVGLQVSAGESNSSVKWVARLTMLTSSDSAPSTNEWILSAYFGAEISFGEGRGDVTKRLRELPMAIDRSIDLRNLNFKDDHDRGLFKRNLGLMLMSTYFVEILGLDDHLGAAYSAANNGEPLKLNTASLVRELNPTTVFDEGSLATAKYCKRLVQSIVGDYILDSTRKRHPLSIVATYDDKIVGQNIVPLRSATVDEQSMIDENQMYTDFMNELTNQACPA
jgi:hypothetical protein